MRVLHWSKFDLILEWIKVCFNLFIMQSGCVASENIQYISLGVWIHFTWLLVLGLIELIIWAKIAGSIAQKKRKPFEFGTTWMITMILNDFHFGWLVPLKEYSGFKLYIFAFKSFKNWPYSLSFEMIIVTLIFISFFFFVVINIMP